MHSTPWLLRRPSGPRKLRLFCFCYAGGNATTYLDWQSSLHPEIEVCPIQMPGRGARFHEEPIRDFSKLITTLSLLIRQENSLPCVFFGHSLGGLVAFELARHLRDAGFAMLQELFVSGCEAPRFRRPSKALHSHPDDCLIDELKRYNGTPPEILSNSELMKLILPTIRADFSLVDNYRYRIDRVLDVPIAVLAGTLEQHDSPEQVTGWSEETSGDCHVEWFEGDHFFINSGKAKVVGFINRRLAPRLRSELVTQTCNV
jgi:medium-chain acyl-[acyl-carrier-protein] hydrolase